MLDPLLPFSSRHVQNIICFLALHEIRANSERVSWVSAAGEEEDFSVNRLKSVQDSIVKNHELVPDPHPLASFFFFYVFITLQPRVDTQVYEP